jgi:hypothetical protein
MKKNLDRATPWTTCALTALFAFTSTAPAHPGHHFFERGAAHVVISPYHLLILTLAGVALVGAARIVRPPVVRVLGRAGATASFILAVLAFAMLAR